ncbi:EVE domain-containing protein [Streptomyces sp. PA03-6a]|nr:EVE domain-containing protein [Streptomyces sp. PA03-6a]
MENWIYILNPNLDTLDGLPSNRHIMLRLAESASPHLDLWLRRRNRMKPGDRLWIFFSQPESAVAAVAEVDAVPRPEPDDFERPYRVKATLLPKATRALHREPVPLAELQLLQVRSVQKVKAAFLPTLLARSGL